MDGILEIAHQLVPNDQEKRLITLQLALITEAENQGLDQAKVTNGTAGEMVVARLLGLSWREEICIQGWDARDQQGRPCEIKSARYKRQARTEMNINYTMTVRKDGEDPTVYCERVRSHYLGCTGGHYWALWTGKDPKIVAYWHIPADKMATFLVHKVESLIKAKGGRLTFKMNFGGKVCRDCGTVHRLEFLARSLNQQHIDWDQLISTRVKERCQRRATDGLYVMSSSIKDENGSKEEEGETSLAPPSSSSSSSSSSSDVAGSSK